MTSTCEELDGYSCPSELIIISGTTSWWLGIVISRSGSIEKVRLPAYLGFMLASLTAEGAYSSAYAPFAGSIIPQVLIALPERLISATPVTFVKAHQMYSDREMGLKVGSIQALIADPNDSPMMLTFEPFIRFI